MTPAARVQAAIELLDQIVAAARDAGPAADTILQRGFAARRYAGSGDRRAIRDLVYAAIRRAGERPESGRAAMLGLAADRPDLPALFDGTPHAPAPIRAGEVAAPAGAMPSWLEARMARPPALTAALLGRAPLDLRVNTLRTTREAVAALFPGATPTPLSPVGLRLAEGIPIDRHPAYLDGRVEVQDEGSQRIALATAAAPGMTVVDLCAGAGGKTLALAAMLGGEGRLVACDTDRARLSRLAPRAARAGASVETRLLDPAREAGTLADLRANADIVLVDAPCSGTGTWRRNPEARWRLTPDRLDALTALQSRLLDLAATLVRPGGALVYAVCSLLAEEGATQAAAFLARTPGWRADAIAGPGTREGPGILLDPATHGTDGFYIARFTAT